MDYARPAQCDDLLLIQSNALTQMSGAVSHAFAMPMGVRVFGFYASGQTKEYGLGPLQFVGVSFQIEQRVDASDEFHALQWFTEKIIGPRFDAAYPVFDGSKASPYVEDDPTAPLNVYGRSKLEGEQAIVASGCAHVILRTSWVYDIRGKNFLRTVLRLAREREELRMVGDQYGAPTWARTRL